jgi:hypothetical protein
MEVLAEWAWAEWVAWEVITVLGNQATQAAPEMAVTAEVGLANREVAEQEKVARVVAELDLRVEWGEQHNRKRVHLIVSPKKLRMLVELPIKDSSEFTSLSTVRIVNHRPTLWVRKLRG